jgi:phosphomevalonate kinase
VSVTIIPLTLVPAPCALIGYNKQNSTKQTIIKKVKNELKDNLPISSPLDHGTARALKSSRKETLTKSSKEILTNWKPHPQTIG